MLSSADMNGTPGLDTVPSILLMLWMDRTVDNTASISLVCPHLPRLHPYASPAAMLRRRAQHWYSALSPGFRSRHAVYLLSLSHISQPFSLSLGRHTIHHLLFSIIFLSQYFIAMAKMVVPSA
jgi:hypothetical protein